MVAKIDVPVLCIGNFTLGGAGKTPVAISLARTALDMGLTPGIVTRGHGGSVKGVHIVNSDKDSAAMVGDEPLLLAKYCLVSVCADRYQGAQALIKQGCDIILMDDGFQSRTLYPDLSLLVVDALRGLGNKAVFPAGPLRAPLKTQLAFTDKILIIGHDAISFDTAVFLPIKQSKIDIAKLQPASSVAILDKKLLAFAGIGNPDKFFASINELGGIIKAKHVFADHHFFSKQEIQMIAAEVKDKNLNAITTAKDYVRLKDQNFAAALKKIIIVDVNVEYKRAHFCHDVLVQTIEKFKNRYV